MGSPLPRVGIQLTADLGSSLSNMGRFERGLKQLDSSLDRVQRGSSSSFRSIERDIGQVSTRGTRGMTVLGRGVTNATSAFGGLARTVAIGGALGAGFAALDLTTRALGAATFGSLGVYRDFNKELTNVGTVAGATAAEQRLLQTTALALGESTAFSAGEVASSLLFLSRAGLDVNKSITALPAVLDLAAASNTDLGDSADFLTNILGAFQADVSEAARFADVLTNTANNSNQSVTELAGSLTFAAPAANALGERVEVTAGAIGLLADQGLGASRAGTSLRRILSVLASPTGEAADEMSRLGISAFTADGEFVGLANAIDNIDQGLEGLNDQQRAASIETIFGLIGSTGVNILLSQGGDALRELTTEIEVTGTASRNAARQMDNLFGSVEEASGAFETLQINVGRLASPAVRAFLDTAVTPSIRQVGGLVGSLADLSDAFRGVAGASAGVIDLGPIRAEVSGVGAARISIGDLFQFDTTPGGAQVIRIGDFIQIDRTPDQIDFNIGDVVKLGWSDQEVTFNIGENVKLAWTEQELTFNIGESVNLDWTQEEFTFNVGEFVDIQWTEAEARFNVGNFVTLDFTGEQTTFDLGGFITLDVLPGSLELTLGETDFTFDTTGITAALAGIGAGIAVLRFSLANAATFGDQIGIITNTVGGLISAIDVDLTPLTTATTSIGDFFSGVTGILPDFDFATLTTSTDESTTAVDSVSTFFSNLTTIVPADFELPSLEGITASVSEFFSGFANILPADFELPSLEGITASVSEFFSGFANILPADFELPSLEGITASVSEFFSGFANILPTDFELPDIDSITTSISDFFSGITTAVGDFDFTQIESVGGFLEVLGTGAAAADTALASFVGPTGTLASITGVVNETLLSISGVIQQADAQAAGQAFTNVITSTLGVFTTLNTLDDVTLTGITSGISSVTQSLLDFGANFVTAFDEVAIGESIETAASSFIASWSKFFAAGDLPGLTDAAGNFTTSLFDEISGILEEPDFEALGIDIGKLTQNLFSEIVDGIVEADFPDIGASFSGLASSLFTGIADGITGVFSGVDFGEVAANTLEVTAEGLETAAGVIEGLDGVEIASSAIRVAKTVGTSFLDVITGIFTADFGKQLVNVAAAGLSLAFEGIVFGVELFAGITNGLSAGIEGALDAATVQENIDSSLAGIRASFDTLGLGISDAINDLFVGINNSLLASFTFGPLARLAGLEPQLPAAEQRDVDAAEARARRRQLTGLAEGIGGLDPLEIAEVVVPAKLQVDPASPLEQPGPIEVPAKIVSAAGTDFTGDDFTVGGEGFRIPATIEIDRAEPIAQPEPVEIETRPVPPRGADFGDVLIDEGQFIELPVRPSIEPGFDFSGAGFVDEGQFIELPVRFTPAEGAQEALGEQDLFLPVTLQPKVDEAGLIDVGEQEFTITLLPQFGPFPIPAPAVQEITPNVGEVETSYEGDLGLEVNVGNFQRDYTGTLTLNVRRRGTIGGTTDSNVSAVVPEARTGSLFHSGGPVRIAEGNNPELIRLPGGGVMLAMTDQITSLPTGTQILSADNTQRALGVTPRPTDSSVNFDPTIATGVDVAALVGDLVRQRERTRDSGNRDSSDDRIKVDIRLDRSNSAAATTATAVVRPTRINAPGAKSAASAGRIISGSRGRGSIGGGGSALISPFAEGTLDAPAGLALMGEAGRELLISGGSVSLVDSPTIGLLSGGEAVLPNRVTEQILSAFSRFTPLATTPAQRPPQQPVTPNQHINNAREITVNVHPSRFDRGSIPSISNMINLLR